MNEGDHVRLVGAASDCPHLIGRQGVIVAVEGPSCSYFNVRVDGPHDQRKFGGADTFLLLRSEIQPLSALEQLAKAGDDSWPDESI